MQSIPVSFVSCALAVTASVARPQKPDAAVPSAEAILAKSDAVRLGKARPEILERVVLRGHFDLVISGEKGFKLKGPFAMFCAGDVVVEEIDYPGWGTRRSGVTSDYAWEVHPAFGTRVYRGADDLTVRRCFGFVRYRGWKRLYQGAELAGTQELEGKPHYVLEMTPKEGKRDRWFVDCKTSLPSKIEIALPGDFGLARVYFGDWRAVDGVLYAHEQKIVAGEATGISVYEKVEHGAEAPADKMLVPDKIKELAQEPPAQDQVGSCRIEHVEEQVAAATRLAVDKSDKTAISRELAKALPAIMLHLNEINAVTAGPPYSRYFGVENGKLEMEAGIPTKAKIETKGKIAGVTLPGGRVATTWHVGPYQELEQSYGRLEKWMRLEGLKGRGAPWEVYWTDPGLEKDPAKWRTQIVWPIE